MPTIYSDIVQTDNDGLATGKSQYDFWPRSIFLRVSLRLLGSVEASVGQIFTILERVGYHHLTLAVGVIVFVVLLTGGTLAPILGTWLAAFVADLGLIAHDFFATGFGIMDEL